MYECICCGTKPPVPETETCRKGICSQCLTEERDQELSEEEIEQLDSEFFAILPALDLSLLPCVFPSDLTDSPF